MYLIAVDTCISMFDESFWAFTSMRTNGIYAKILALVIFRPRKNIILSSENRASLNATAWRLKCTYWHSSISIQMPFSLMKPGGHSHS